ncbi:MAG: DUF29 family protein [Acetobacteraceae bacterium]|jgi:hypothetical protein
MPDDLYDHDILTWSHNQTALLRRLARGERVKGVDWVHVVEEIEDVGLSELNAVAATCGRCWCICSRPGMAGQPGDRSLAR